MFDTIQGLLMVFVALLILDVAALRYGVDSRTSVLLRDPYRRDL